MYTKNLGWTGPNKPAFRGPAVSFPESFSQASISDGDCGKTSLTMELLLKGLTKVKGEVGFTVLAYDMRRTLNMLGTKKLLNLVKL